MERTFLRRHAGEGTPRGTETKVVATTGTSIPPIRTAGPSCGGYIIINLSM